MRLLQFQVSAMGTPSPAGTPTNLLYIVVPTLGGLWRYWQQRQPAVPLTLLQASAVSGASVAELLH